MIGQDLDHNEDGVFVIARRVTKNQVISTSNPETRHGRKSSAHGFDGFKGHIAIDADSEIITETAVTRAISGDGASAMDLLANDLARNPPAEDLARNLPADDLDAPGDVDGIGAAVGGPARGIDQNVPADPSPSDARDASDASGDEDYSKRSLTVYGDAAYGRGESLEDFAGAGLHNMCKVPQLSAANGMFSKDEFAINQQAGTVGLPGRADHRVKAAGKSKGIAARFGAVCTTACPLAAACTKARGGRTIRVGPHEARLAYERARQRDPGWVAEYRRTRPELWNAKSGT